MKFSMLKIYLIIIPVAILIGSWDTVQEPKSEGIVWITWEEAVALQATDKNPKKVFVDVYTDWCGWCKVMDKQTFNHPEVAKYMSDHFYMVKLDAQQKEDIEYNGVTLKYIAPSTGARGYHQLAVALLNNKLSFPTVVFLDEEMRIIQPVPGFQKPKIFYTMASYFATDNYKEKPWPEFQKENKPPF